MRVGVLHGGYDAGDTGIDQRIGARRRTPVVAAGFQGDVGGGTAGLVASLAQSMHLGMGLAGADMPAFADNDPIADDNAADTGIGMGGIQAFTGQFQGAGHQGMVAVHHQPWAGSRDRRSISSRNSLRS